MSVVQEFTVGEGQTEKSFRLQKSAHHLLIKRRSTLALILCGLMDGLPEKVTAEITHPVRKRVQPCDRIPLAHIAAWAQFGRGAILETAQFSGLADVNFGQGASGVEADDYIEVTTVFYLNDNGPVELLSDDQFNITITGLVPGATYTIYAPEMPIVAAFANQYYAYEQSLILEGDRDKKVFVKGIDGLIIPNNADAITRLTIEWQVDEYTTKEEEYTLYELMKAMEDANPTFNVIHYNAPRARDIDDDQSPASLADFLLLDTKKMVAVTIYTVLGERVEYTTIKLADRNI